MKKLYFLLICFVVVCISCSSDSSSDSLNPNLLQRVDFYPGTTYERRWNFNEDGLLTSITKADGTVVENFTYDSLNRLISSTAVSNTGTTETHTFTYDSNDFVTTLDGVTINYDSSLDAYYTGDLNTAYRLTKLNNDKLLIDGKSVVIDNDESGISESQWLQMSVNYSNNNIVSYFPYYENCNYLSYDDKVNPLQNATRIISKPFSFVAGSRWAFNELVSANNALTHDYCSEDPESSIYHYTYNSNNLPITQTRDDYYNGVYENTISAAKYYYQGDVIP